MLKCGDKITWHDLAGEGEPDGEPQPAEGSSVVFEAPPTKPSLSLHRPDPRDVPHAFAWLAKWAGMLPPEEFHRWFLGVKALGERTARAIVEPQN